MATKDHGSSVKDDEVYERLREEGAGKEKAARIANSPRSEVGERGGKAPPYEDWSVDELRDRAQDLGVEGRSNMNKDELIKALRSR